MHDHDDDEHAPASAIERAERAARVIGLGPRDELTGWSGFAQGGAARVGFVRLVAADPALATACDEAGLAVAASDDDPALVEVDAPRAALRWEGRVREDGPHHLAIDARAEAAVVQVVAPGVELALVVERGRVEGARVARRIDLRARPSVAPLSLPAPEVAALLAATEAPAWARDVAEALATSASPLDRLAAAGLCARVAAPRADDDDDDEAPVARSPRGPAPDASESVRAWSRALDGGSLARLEALALARVDALDDAIAHFAEALTAGALAGAARDRAAVRLCHDRDDLESVALVLRLVDRHELVVRSLAALDGRVSAGHAASALEAAGAAGDRPYASVTPGAWWLGAAALQRM